MKLLQHLQCLFQEWFLFISMLFKWLMLLFLFASAYFPSILTWPEHFDVTFSFKVWASYILFFFGEIKVLFPEEHIIAAVRVDPQLTWGWQEWLQQKQVAPWEGSKPFWAACPSCELSDFSSPFLGLSHMLSYFNLCLFQSKLSATDALGSHSEVYSDFLSFILDPTASKRLILEKLCRDKL